MACTPLSSECQKPLPDAVAERYGATTRFRQHFEGEGSYLDENDVSILGLPLTFLATNIP